MAGLHLSQQLSMLIFTITMAMSASLASAGSLKSPEELERSETTRNLQRLIDENAPNSNQARDAMKAGPASRSGRRATRNRRKRGSKRIVNGIGTALIPAAGALLKGNDRRSAKMHCSGTLIGCNMFLTAAHCIEKDLNEKSYKVFFQSAGFFDVEKISWQKDKYDFPNADVAVLKLSRPVEGIAPLPINKTSKPVNGTIGIIAGFGRTGGFNYDYGIKRIGSVKTDNCTGDHSNKTLVCWKYDADVGVPGEDSNTCNADSGGGLYIGDERLIAGVTSGGVRSSCLSGDRSYDANIYNYHTWIEKVSEGDLTTKSCGAIPSIDETRHVVSEIEHLDETTRQIRFPFNIPSTSATLRVAVNGEDDGRGKNDFDLHLIPGNSKVGQNAVCVENGSGQFGFCEVNNPAPGPWTILVKRKKGAGRVQITLTVVPK